MTFLLNLPLEQLGHANQPVFRPLPGCRLSEAIISSLLLLFFALPSLAQIDDQENAVLERWLEDRQLDSLLTDQLESRLESTVDADKREEIARQLAKLYGRKLLSVDDDAEAVIKRTRELISLYPQFETGRLRVAMLHARYLESENMFRDWIRGGAREGSKRSLEKNIAELDQDLTFAITALAGRSEELFAAGQLDRNQRALEVERRAVDAEALHCQFLAGWSRYFLALLSAKEQSEILEKAEQSFREFLQLDSDSTLNEFDSRWFDFSSVWHVRAIAGLAAIATVRGDDKQVSHLYELLRNNAVTREGREATIRFRFLGYFYCGKYEEAMNVLRDRNAIRMMSREGRIRLWMTVIETSRASDSDSFEKLALVGLARNTVGDLLVKEFAASSWAEQPAETFESCWVSGYVEFWKSENGESEAATKASDFLQRALLLGNESPNDLARCRYLHAWLMLKRGELEGAISSFSRVSDQLAEVDPILASESAWLSAKAAIQLGKRDNSQWNNAWNRLERFVRKWPDSQHASTADFEKLRIELKSIPASDAIRRLNEIDSGTDNFGPALFEIATQSYRLFESDGDSEAMNKLRRACRDVHESNATSATQKAKSAFLLVNALLRNENVPFDEVDSLLQRSRSWVGKSTEAKTVEVELLYYQLQFLQRKGDVEAALASALRVAEQGKQTRFEVPALIHIAKYHDAKLEGLATASKDRVEPAIAVYQQLSRRFGAGTDQLKSSSNARVAYSRLGELYLMGEMDAESELIFQKLVETFPGNANYLRWLAVAKSKRDTEGATRIWQRLAAGSEAGSDLWYESKLELAKSIGSTDKASAAQLIRQTMQLGGELPERWQNMYQAALNRFAEGGDLQ